MRQVFTRAVGRLTSAAAVLVSLLVVGCADSPTEQLSRAENLLVDLSSKGAEAYLKYELAGARQKIEEVRQFIRKHRFEAASQYLNGICNTLDSCSVAFLKMRQVAEQQCDQRMTGLFSSLETMRAQMNGLPRQSYIDQNRFDIYTHRLRRYREEMDLLQKLVAQQDFNAVLQRCPRLEFQVKQSLAGLTGVTPIPERVGPTNLTTGADTAPTPLAASMGHSGSR